MYKRIIFTIVLLAFVVVGLLAKGFFQGSQPTTPTSGRLHGTILITSTATSTIPHFLDTYAVDLANHTVNVTGSDDSSSGTMYSFSPDDSKVTFIGVTAQSVADANEMHNPGVAFQVYEAGMTGSALPMPSGARVVTANPLGKMTPAISDDGSSIVYVAPTAQTASSTSGDAYDIHLVSAGATASSDRVITQGTQPRWFSNTAFYYIAPDGVRLWRLSTNSSVLALPVQTSNNFKLSLSPDKKYLAVSIPDARKVFVFTTSQNGDYLTSVGKGIDILGFWVVFSPDSATMAIQTVAEQQDGTTAHPSLVFYNTASLAKLPGSVGLDPLLNDRLFVTGWYY